MKMILRRAANPDQISMACQKYTYGQVLIGNTTSCFPCSMNSRWFYYSIFDYLRGPWGSRHLLMF